MSFTEYLKKYKFIWLSVILFNVICHSFMLLNSSVGIDTEAILFDPQGLYTGWLNTGRAGLVLLKYLTGTYHFNVYVAGIGTIFFLSLSCALWTYLFYKITGKESGLIIVIFSGILSSSPILTEQMYFKLQAMEVAICFCLVAISVYLSHRFALQKKWGCFLASLPFSIIAFASYQAFNGLYLFGAVASFLLYYYFDYLESDKDISTSRMWFYIMRFAGCFFTAFLVNQIITKLFFDKSTYLDGMSVWKSESIGTCVINIIKHVGKVLLARHSFYTFTFVIFVLVTMILCGRALLQHKLKNGKYLGVTVVALLFMAPFFLTIICGKEPVVRSQLIFPFTLSFMAYILFLFDIEKLQFSRLIKICSILLCMGTVAFQLKYTWELNYTDNVRYQGDVKLASAIMEEIDKLQDEENSYSLLFMGKQKAALNESCAFGETIGYSLFDWDADVEPKGFYNSRRVVGLMNYLGAEYKSIPIEKVKGITEKCIGMNSWPMEGSIQFIDGVIVVKLSD